MSIEPINRSLSTESYFANHPIAWARAECGLYKEILKFPFDSSEGTWSKEIFRQGNQTMDQILTSFYLFERLYQDDSYDCFIQGQYNHVLSETSYRELKFFAEKIKNEICRQYQITSETFFITVKTAVLLQKLSENFSVCRYYLENKSFSNPYNLYRRILLNLFNKPYLIYSFHLLCNGKNALLNCCDLIDFHKIITMEISQEDLSSLIRHPHNELLDLSFFIFTCSNLGNFGHLYPRSSTYYTEKTHQTFKRIHEACSQTVRSSQSYTPYQNLVRFFGNNLHLNSDYQAYEALVRIARFFQLQENQTHYFLTSFDSLSESLITSFLSHFKKSEKKEIFYHFFSICRTHQQIKNTEHIKIRLAIDLIRILTNLFDQAGENRIFSFDVLENEIQKNPTRVCLYNYALDETGEAVICRTGRDSNP